MRIIKELSEYIKDEAHGARKYAKKAIKYKAENKELADMFYAMANTELEHLDKLHAWVVKFIEKQKSDGVKIPQGMLDVWEWEHMQMISEISDLRIMLQGYSKL